MSVPCNRDMYGLEAMAGSQSTGSSLACGLALLITFVTTVVSSAVASLFLFFRIAAARLSSWVSQRGTPGEQLLQDENSDRRGCQLYEGTVRHIRRHPVKHAFSYPVRCAVIDMDGPPAWFMASSARHHMTADEVRKMAGTKGAVHLLTNPVSVGYEQNPISVFFCFDEPREGQAQPDLALCIAEVTNTPWGERCTFTFSPTDGVPKPLHVSPFMDMASTWRIRTEAPGASLRVSFVAAHPAAGDFFLASLHARRVERPAHPEAFLWLMPHRVAFWIYCQAWVLWWKGVALVEHPKYTDGDQYRHRLLARNREERHLFHAGTSGAAGAADEKVPPGSMPAGGCIFQWQDAAGWPWK